MCCCLVISLGIWISIVDLDIQIRALEFCSTEIATEKN